MTLSAPVPLTDDHDIAPFHCGVASLDDWLKKRAIANQASGASRTFVLCSEHRVVAYYALASGSIASNEATGRFRRNMPDPVPVVILARLAIDHQFHGREIGRALVRDAAKRVVTAGDAIGIRGMIAHAISEEAKAFYLALGFIASPTHDMTVMVSMVELRDAL